MWENSKLKSTIAKNTKLYNFFKPYMWEIPYNVPRYNDFYSFKSRVIKAKEDEVAIISEVNAQFGTWERWIRIADKVRVALEYGYIPVIDFMNFKPREGNYGCYLDLDINFWDFYFCQYQNEISVDSLNYSDYEVSYFTDVWRDELMDPFSVSFGNTDDAYNVYHKLWNCIGAKRDIFADIYDRTLPEDTLGVMLRRSMDRGNDTKIPLYCNWKGHHKRGQLFNYLKWTEEKLNQGEYKYVFISSDDREGLERFKQEFGDRCIYYDRRLVNHFKNGKAVSDIEKLHVEFQDLPGELFMKQLEYDYICETLMLSKCDALMSNPNGLEKIVRIITNNKIKIIPNNVYLEMYY